MIKLIELLNELDKPENIYAPGQGPEDTSDKFGNQGFRTVNTTIDPETGRSTSDVVYRPNFEKIKMELGNYSSTFRPYKHKVDKSIALVATKLVTALNKAGELTTVLGALLDAEVEKNKNRNV